MLIYDDQAAIGKRLKDWMDGAGVTTKEISRTLGVKPRTFQSWTRGDRGFTLSTAARICGLFGRSLDELVGMRWCGDDNPRPSVGEADEPEDTKKEEMADGGQERTQG